MLYKLTHQSAKSKELFFPSDELAWGIVSVNILYIWVLTCGPMGNVITCGILCILELGALDRNGIEEFQNP